MTNPDERGKGHVLITVDGAFGPTGVLGIVTSSFDDGRTVVFQRRFSPFITRSAPRTRPLATVNALSLSVVYGIRLGGHPKPASMTSWSYCPV